MTWQPKWYKTALTAAAANGWNLIEQPDGRLAFASATRREPIVSTGNDEDAPHAIDAAVAAMKRGAVIPSTPDPLPDLAPALKQTTDRISAAIPIAKAIVDGRRMSKLAAVADRMTAKRAAHDAKADAFMARLDVIDKAEPAAFTRGEAFLKDREADLREFEDTLRQLTNLPLSDSEM